MDAYETNLQEFTDAVIESRWADAEAAARRNIDIVRTEGLTADCHNLEYWTARMNAAHLKRTLAAEIAAQDTDAE